MGLPIISKVKQFFENDFLKIVHKKILLKDKFILCYL